MAFNVGTTKVMMLCDACGKTFKARHRCKVSGASMRINTWGITVRGGSGAIMVIPVVRVELP